MKYLPFLSGKYSTAPGLTAMAKTASAQDKLIFQIDDQYHAYIANKEACRAENITKYYVEARLFDETIIAINKFFAEHLVKEHAEIFSLQQEGDSYFFTNKKTAAQLSWKSDWIKIDSPKYLSLFDALCSQVQEDVAICQLSDSDDWLAAIHLSSPNHWAPREKVGRPFNFVHEPVADMEKTVQQYPKMLATAVQKGPFTRFAWGIATDNRLNHHPEPPPGFDHKLWGGRMVGENGTKFFIRTEKQNIVGFPETNAFFFTIRTYFYEVETLQPEEKKALVDAVESMSPAALHYKGLTQLKPLLIEQLT